MKKRLLSMLLVACMVVAMLPVQVWAAAEYVSGTNPYIIDVLNGSCTDTEILSALVGAGVTESDCTRYRVNGSGMGNEFAGSNVSWGDATHHYGVASINPFSGFFSKKGTFQTRTYYTPVISISDASDYKNAEISAPNSKVYNGGQVTITVPSVNGYAVTVVDGDNDAITMSGDTATVTVNSANDATFVVSYTEVSTTATVNVGIVSGTSVYVNYGDDDFTEGNITVKANNYTVER